jgi:hypothetical protein
MFGVRLHSIGGLGFLGSLPPDDLFQPQPVKVLR